MNASTSPSAVAQTSIGARVVCGVDGTSEGLEAARQAARLVDPTGSLALVSVFNIGAAAGTGYLASRTAAEMERDAQRALDAAVAAVGIEPETHLVDGEPYAAIEAQADKLDATLVVVGTHELRRGLGIMFGSVATASSHIPTRATLIARDAGAPIDRFPRSVTVAEDGSPASERARVSAAAIAERFDADFRRIVYTAGKPDLEAVQSIPGADVIDGDPRKGLIALSDEVDLLVVGSTGRRGLRALGSVSEHVAHGATCSVLVVPAAA